MEFNHGRVVDARASAGMTQADLAYACRRLNPRLRPDSSAISKVEHDTVPGANLLAAIAEATDRDFTFFFAADPAPRRPDVVRRRAAAHRKLDEAISELALSAVAA